MKANAAGASPNTATNWRGRHWCSAVWWRKRYSPYLKQCYERIKQRRGGGKAKVALARKLVKIVYDTLKNDWVFADFPSFTLAA